MMAVNSNPCVFCVVELTRLYTSEEPLNISIILSRFELIKVVSLSKIWFDSGLAPLSLISLLMSKGWFRNTGALLFSSISLSMFLSPLVLVLAFVLLVLACPALPRGSCCSLVCDPRLLIPPGFYMLELFLRLMILLCDWLAGPRSTFSTFSLLSPWARGGLLPLRLAC